MPIIFQHLRQDLIYALRQLRRSPGFATIAVLTLALGIGANTAIFSLLDQALLRSLPVRDPQQLVVLEGTGDVWEGHSSSYGGDVAAYFSYPMYKDLRDWSQTTGTSVFEGLVAIDHAQVGLSYRESASLAQAEIVSGNFFTLLGVGPAVGRVFTQQEDLEPNAAPVAVLSYGFWKNKFGGDARVVGQTVTINGHPFVIVGVAAPGFQSAIAGENSDLFVPMMMRGQVKTRYGSQDDLTLHTSRWLTILGRLKDGETPQQAQAAVGPLWKALRAEELKALGRRSPKFVNSFLTTSKLLVLPGAKGFSYSRTTMAKPLYVVMGMALLVLLMATVNVASLLLVRSAGRLREFSLRYALGADRGRILQQLLLEGLMIGVAGGAAAIALAPLATRVLVERLAGGDGGSAYSAGITAPVVGFNFAVAVLVSVVFSLAPALQLLKPDLIGPMKRQGGGSGSLLGLRRVVVCLQIGLSVLLLIGSGLFMRTMQNLRHVDAGFSTDHLVTFGVDPSLAGYGTAQIQQLHRRILDTLAALPGVRSVSATDQKMLAGDSHGGNVEVPGFVEPPDTNYDIEEDFITPDFLKNLQTPLLTGRMFTEADDATHPNVTIVNETFAKHYFGSAQAALGRRVSRVGRKNVNGVEIVGVAADSLHQSIRSGVDPTLFRPVLQNEDPAAMQFYVRTELAPEAMLPAVRLAMQQLDSKLALDGLLTMEQQIDFNLSNERMIVLLAISFGVLATLLAGIGLYGVLAYVTAQRTREIGVRIALGSSRVAISGIVLSDVLKLAGISIVVAVPVALGLTRLLRSQLFGVTASDPLTFTAVIVVVALVAIAAALIPAHRAANVDPIEALRTE